MERQAWVLRPDVENVEGVEGGGNISKSVGHILNMCHACDTSEHRGKLL